MSQELRRGPRHSRVRLHEAADRRPGLAPHPLPPGIRKAAAAGDDGGDVAQGLELPVFAGGEVGERAGGGVETKVVAGADFLAETRVGLEGNQVAAVDRVAK